MEGDLCFVLDCSRFMMPYIAAAKDFILQMSNYIKFTNPNIKLRVSFVAIEIMIMIMIICKFLILPTHTKISPNIYKIIYKTLLIRMIQRMYSEVLMYQ